MAEFCEKYATLEKVLYLWENKCDFTVVPTIDCVSTIKKEKSIANADPDPGELNASNSALVSNDDSDSFTCIADTVDRSTIADIVDKSTRADTIDKSTNAHPSFDDQSEISDAPLTCTDCATDPINNTSTENICNLISVEDVHVDCSNNPINDNSTVDPMLAEGICGDCSVDPVNTENMSKSELLTTEKPIATSSDYPAKHSDVDCTIVTSLSGINRLENMVNYLLLMDALIAHISISTVNRENFLNFAWVNV